MRVMMAMPGREIRKVILLSDPHLLQRQWLFCGSIPRGCRDYEVITVACDHGLNGAYAVRDWLNFCILKCVVVIVSRRVPAQTRVFVGQCRACERVLWMLGRRTTT